MLSNEERENILIEEAIKKGNTRPLIDYFSNPTIKFTDDKNSKLQYSPSRRISVYTGDLTVRIDNRGLLDYMTREFNWTLDEIEQLKKNILNCIVTNKGT